MHPPRHAVRWFALAVVALAVSGLLAGVLVLSRVPAITAVVTIDPELARRSLVVHVNLATGTWFFAFLAGLFCLGPGARRQGTSILAVTGATAGVIAFTASALSGGNVVLADYVPVIDHPLFLAGIAAFAGGVVLAMWPRARSTGDVHALPLDVQHGVRASGIAFVTAIVTVVAAYLVRDPSATELARFEHVFWGGGHVLQFAATAGMLATWLLLTHHIVGASVVSSNGALALFALLLLPTSLAPWLVLTGQSPRAFTWMMELGIAPVVLVVIVAVAALLRRQWRCSGVHWPAQSIAFAGLATSIGMTLLGFALGAAIAGDTTLTPAHYHVSIGAVTVSFMSTLVVLLHRYGAPVRWPRLSIWQPVLYGGGQTVFALGLAIAGFWGHAARKQYDAEPVVSAAAERAGWMIAGVGGLLAFVGGVAFVVIVIGHATGMRRRS